MYEIAEIFLPVSTEIDPGDDENPEHAIASRTRPHYKTVTYDPPVHAQAQTSKSLISLLYEDESHQGLTT